MQFGNDKIVSVNRDVVPINATANFPAGQSPPLFAHVVHAETFRLWADLAMASFADWNVDFDLDGTPDALFFKPDSQTGNWSIVLLGSTLCQQAECTFQLPIPFVNTPSTAAFVAADFNHDGFVDPVFQIDGAPFYFAADPLNLGNFLPTNGFFSFLPNAYESFAVGDFNGDGIADLEARKASGFVDVYAGQQGAGLQPGLDAGAFPSFTGEDGRFTTVTGTGNSTVNFTKSQFLIEVPSNRTSFDVHVFDGNQSGAGKFSPMLRPTWIQPVALPLPGQLAT